MRTRRQVIAQGEAAALRRLSELGALPEGVEAPAAAKRSPEPLAFSLDDGEGDDAASTASGASSMEDWERDWEHGLAALNGATCVWPYVSRC